MKKNSTSPPKKLALALFREANNFAAWGGLAIGALGLLISLYSVYIQNREVRSLTVIASDSGSSGNEIRLSAIYRNSGDTTEVVTDAVLTVTKNRGNDVFYRVNLEPCYTPVIVGPDQAVHRIYHAHVPYFARPLKGASGDVTQSVILEIYTASAAYAPIRTDIAVAQIARDPVMGKITSTRVRTGPTKIRLGGYGATVSYQAVRKLPTSSRCTSFAP